MAKATIKSKSGAVITIEGSDIEVSNVIAFFEKTTHVGQMKEIVVKNKIEKKENKKRESTSDLVIHLRESGFLDKPKNLGEISAALEEQGYLCPTTTLSGVVLGLVQKRELRRKKIEGKWVYGK